MSEIVRKIKESRVAQTLTAVTCGTIALASCGTSTARGESYTQSLRAQVGCPNGTELVIDVKEPADNRRARAFVTAACVSEDGDSSPLAYVELDEEAITGDYDPVPEEFQKPTDTSGLDSYLLTIEVPGRTADEESSLLDPYVARSRESRPVVADVMCNYDLGNNGNTGASSNNYRCTPESVWTNIELHSVAQGNSPYSDEEFMTNPDGFSASDVRVEIAA